MRARASCAVCGGGAAGSSFSSPHTLCVGCNTTYDVHVRLCYDGRVQNFFKLVRVLSEQTHHAMFNLRRRLRLEVARADSYVQALDNGTLTLPDAVLEAVSACAGADAEGVNEYDLVIRKMEEAAERLLAGIIRCDNTALLLSTLNLNMVDVVTGEDVERLALNVLRKKLG